MVSLVQTTVTTELPAEMERRAAPEIVAAVVATAEAATQVARTQPAEWADLVELAEQVEITPRAELVATVLTAELAVSAMVVHPPAMAELVVLAG
jgi:hypothetical protein